MAESGDRIGAYEVVRLIARGGMATVYEAYQPALDRSVALKRLDLRSNDPKQAERFVRESRVAAAFNHPNIVTVFDFFEVDAVPYIAMEYLPRGSLRQCVDRLKTPQVCGVLEWILRGLSHSEEYGVAHRDLKPENVLITRTGEVKIADYGIAKAYINATVQFSSPGMAVGTPTYMAPEQAMAQPVGPYTDLYALGVMAYEMLSGDPPFECGDSPVSLMYKHVSEPPPPLTNVDPRLAAWVARLLEKAPAARPHSARHAWLELEPTVVDLLGPFWRNDATLGEIPKEEYVTVVGGEAIPLETPEDDYTTVAGDQAQPAEPDPARAPEPEPERVREPLPEPQPAPEPEPVAVATHDPGTSVTTPPTRTVALPQEPAGGRTRRGIVAGIAMVAVAAVAVAAVALTGGASEGDDAGSGGAGADGRPTTKAAAPFDFAGNGTATAVVGMPHGGPRRAGAVTVDPQSEPLTASDPTPRARFGAAVASADFDSDGHGDLAVGAPGAATVTVYYATDDELAGARSSTLSGDGRLGAALAAGDLNGDGYGDLAVGAPDGHGAIRLLFGGREGLPAEPARELQAPGGATGFGSILAIGDVDHDGRLDLAEAGGDHSSFCAGGKGGPYACEAIGRGGPAALAVGDLTGDGFDDIVQGFPEAGDDAKIQYDTGPGPAGALRMWRGSDGGPVRRPILITQETKGVAGNGQALDAFGAALAITDLNDDRFADLVVGAPGEDADRGRVTLVNGGPKGHGSEDVGGYGSDTNRSHLPITLTPGSRFGAAISLLDVDDDGRADLIVTSPGNGAVVTLPGTESGRFTKKGSNVIKLPEGVTDITLGAP